MNAARDMATRIVAGYKSAHAVRITALEVATVAQALLDSALTQQEIAYVIACVERDPRGLQSTADFLSKLKAM